MPRPNQSGERSTRAGAVGFARVPTKPSHEFRIPAIVEHVDDDLRRRYRQGLAFGAGNPVLAHIARSLALVSK